ncbi:vacuolar fusion protein CCZ1 homolog B-like [Papio anubis]|uniref:vacuolar fusion protein CCZ1 homolog B-like n=1 Tax=Papio anubis TaxID=9555 RepID=UPI0012AD8527|nr:vacuolar fusion protein CCZ1 homolog B-like [Papio anubis]
MAAAAAGAGSGPWATQEKQFPPVLLSFFIYNPRFGPREGEVCGGGRARSQRARGTASVPPGEAALWFCPPRAARTLAGRDSPVRAEMPGNLQHYGRFLTGPLNLNDPDAKCRFPKIFVNTHDAYEELHLIVYKAMFFSVCFLFYTSIQPTLDFCRRLDSVVGPQLTVLASDICEQFNINKRMSGSEKEPQFKFIYFNHMNLDEKSTVHMRKTPSVSPLRHPDLMKILGDINSDFTRVDEDEEIIVKAMSDYWVVGKKSDRRELYVILNQKNANLIEVNGRSCQVHVAVYNNPSLHQQNDKAFSPALPTASANARPSHG